MTRLAPDEAYLLLLEAIDEASRLPWPKREPRWRQSEEANERRRRAAVKRWEERRKRDQATV